MIGAVFEARDVLQKYGPGTDRKIDLDWLHVPRESFDAGGWDEMVGKTITCGVLILFSQEKLYNVRNQEFVIHVDSQIQTAFVIKLKVRARSIQG